MGEEAGPPPHCNHLSGYWREQWVSHETPPFWTQRTGFVSPTSVTRSLQLLWTAFVSVAVFLVGQLIFFLPWLPLEAYHSVPLCELQRENGCRYSEWRGHAEESILSDISCPMHRKFRLIRHWPRLPRRPVDTPSLAVPCTMLDEALWIWSTGGISAHGGVGTWWTLRSLPTQNSLWFCDSFYEMCSKHIKDGNSASLWILILIFLLQRFMSKGMRIW